MLTATLDSKENEEDRKMNELELHTLRRMEDDPTFFIWINGDFGEALMDYYVYLKMIEAQSKYGS